ncbi:MAG: hypothetical protein ACOCUH_02730, partial [Bacteriovoracia bacterium]
EGKITRKKDDDFDIDEDGGKQKVKIKCTMFDHSENYDMYENPKYLLSVYKASEDNLKEIDLRIDEGRDKLYDLQDVFKDEEAGKSYDAYITRSLSSFGDKIKIGSFTLY